MKEKIYIIFKNNEEEYDDYSDWIIEIYKDKERAENRFVKLVKTNQYKKDRAIGKAKYNENIGAYRIEEHEIESEKRQDEVIDTNASNIEEDIKIVEKLLQMAHVDDEEYYKQIEIGDITFDAIKNLLLGYKKYKNMYEAEHRIHLVRNEQLSRKEKAIIKCKELERENEELKFEERSRIIGKYGDAEIHDVINRTLSNDYISVKKVKDKIEAYKKFLLSCNKILDVDRIRAINERILELQELLESEDSKDGEN